LEPVQESRLIFGALRRAGPDGDGLVGGDGVVALEEGIPHGLKPDSVAGIERAKPEGLAYLEEKQQQKPIQRFRPAAGMTLRVRKE
jgi:hypothetical protein